MPKNEALLQAIIHDPEDDGLRLMYADWLEENGHGDRAEFIRVQIELAHLHAADPQRDRLTDREQALLKKHEDCWKAELPEPQALWGRWRRGFIDEVYGGAGQLPACLLR